ncbi:hypothetical protein ACWIGW_31865 [Nocardia brasiliensis]
MRVDVAVECGRFDRSSWAAWKRFFHLLLVAATAAVIAACGPPNPGMPELPELPPLGAVTAAAPVVGEPIADSDRLRNQLLTLADMPPNFTVQPSVSLEAPSNPSTSPVDPAECTMVGDPLVVQRPGALAQAAVHYMGRSYTDIYIDAASYPNEAVAVAFSEVQAILRRCTHYVGHHVGARGTEIADDYRVGGLAQPPAGDASTAFQAVKSNSNGGQARYSAAIVQVGSTLMQLWVDRRLVREREGLLSDLIAAQVRRLQGVR